jgi:hypothetical protein
MSGPRLCSRCLLPGHDKRKCRAVLPSAVNTSSRSVKLSDGSDLVITFTGDPLRMTSNEAQWLAEILLLLDEHEANARKAGAA